MAAKTTLSISVPSDVKEECELWIRAYEERCNPPTSVAAIVTLAIKDWLKRNRGGKVS